MTHIPYYHKTFFAQFCIYPGPSGAFHLLTNNHYDLSKTLNCDSCEHKMTGGSFAAFEINYDAPDGSTHFRGRNSLIVHSVQRYRPSVCVLSGGSRNFLGGGANPRRGGVNIKFCQFSLISASGTGLRNKFHPMHIIS